MKVVPLAADSLGVRSLATLVYFGKNRKNIIIDPSAALGPKRYGLSPTKEEYEMLDLSFKRIIKYSRLAKIVFVTHYHYDHHPFPDETELYEKIFSDKIVIAVDYKKMHRSGYVRGKRFDSVVKEYARDVIFSYGEEYKFGSIRVETSPLVWHGEVNSKVGKVQMIFIKKGKNSYLFGSDAQNLYDPKAMEWFIEKNPEIATIDGYPTIFIGWRFSSKKFNESKINLTNAINKTKVRIVVLDHHILRDIDYKEKIADVISSCKKTNIVTAAEYLGLENFMLEAWRKKIHKKEISVDVKDFDKKVNSAIKSIVGV